MFLNQMFIKLQVLNNIGFVDNFGLDIREFIGYVKILIFKVNILKIEIINLINFRKIIYLIF